MSIAGDLKLNGYPKNIIVRYAKNGSDKDYPYLYEVDGNKLQCKEELSNGKEQETQVFGG